MKRRRAVAAGLAALAIGGLTAPTASGAPRSEPMAAAATAASRDYAPVVPERRLDTRNGIGAPVGKVGPARWSSST